MRNIPHEWRGSEDTGVSGELSVLDAFLVVCMVVGIAYWLYLLISMEDGGDA